MPNAQFVKEYREAFRALTSAETILKKLLQETVYGRINEPALSDLVAAIQMQQEHCLKELDNQSALPLTGKGT